MRTWLIAVVMLAAGLSGCLGGDDATPEQEDGSEQLGPETDQNGTLDATNTAPEVALAADNTTVTAPANVTFSIAALDPDGDDQSFSLDVTGDGEAEAEGTLVADDNGTYAPFEFVYSYASAGNYSAIVELTDGEHAANATVAITVLEPAAVDAGEEEPAEPVDDGDPWVERDAEGHCHATGFVYEVGPGYIHERGDTPGTGYALGDGTWIYEEGNDIPGLQIGGPGEQGPYVDCTNPDVLIW